MRDGPRRRPLDGNKSIRVAKSYLSDSGPYGMIAIMKSGELGSGYAQPPSRRVTRVGDPRVLILTVAALVLTNIPLVRYRSGG